MQSAILGYITGIQMPDANEMRESSVVVGRGCRFADWQSLRVDVWMTRVDVKNEAVSSFTVRDTVELDSVN